jgi:DNA polymerase-3 subunit gamma/tau
VYELAITTKYRPTDFSEVFGQDVAVRILQNTIKMNRVPVGILFSGTRGSGKTTLARIYAKALNCDNEVGNCCKKCNTCLTNPDVIEIDAASNNGVDDIRLLAEKLSIAKLSKYRVVILDECHYLSGAAQAAFLKILEEPPKGTVFLLVTTNPEKLENTVRSRCMDMTLKSVRSVDIYNNLKWVLAGEGISATEGFVQALANSGLGSFRDIQQILEQAILFSGDEGCTEDILVDIAGMIPTTHYKDLAAALCSLDMKYFMEEIGRWYFEGRDLKQLFVEGLPKLLRDFVVYLTGADLEFYSGISEETLKNNLTLDLEMVRFGIRLVGELDGQMRNSSQERLAWECFLAKFFEGMKM